MRKWGTKMDRGRGRRRDRQEGREVERSERCATRGMIQLHETGPAMVEDPISELLQLSTCKASLSSGHCT